MKYFERWPLVTALIICTLVSMCFKYNFMSEMKPDFSKIANTADRKEAFLSFMYKNVLLINMQVRHQREKLLSIKKMDIVRFGDKLYIRSLNKKYRLEGSNKMVTELTFNEQLNQLLLRVNEIPPALILAQAANESAWGTSRFARQANNYFGIWCFTKGCGLVPKMRSSGQVHEVRYFASARASVGYYVQLLNSHKTYTKLRTIRANLPTEDIQNSAINLAAGLGHYSERGEDYIKDIRSLIRFNKLSEKYPLYVSNKH